jgi:hypothetical protein
MSTSPNWLFIALGILAVASVIGATIHFTSKD